MSGSGKPLGDLQVAVLQVLNAWRWSLPTNELAYRVRMYVQGTSSPYWYPSDEGVAACARRLVNRGLVTAEKTSTGARCWSITPSGREAAAEVSS